MEIRFYEIRRPGTADTYTGTGVSEDEVRQGLTARAAKDLTGDKADSRREASARLRRGRYLASHLQSPTKIRGVFVITAPTNCGQRENRLRRRQRKAAMTTPEVPPGMDEERIREVLAHTRVKRDEQFADMSRQGGGGNDHDGRADRS